MHAVLANSKSAVLWAYRLLTNDIVRPDQILQVGFVNLGNRAALGPFLLVERLTAALLADDTPVCNQKHLLKHFGQNASGGSGGAIAETCSADLSRIDNNMRVQATHVCLQLVFEGLGQTGTQLPVLLLQSAREDVTRPGALAGRNSGM